jgi:hypothetical protein
MHHAWCVSRTLRRLPTVVAVSMLHAACCIMLHAGCCMVRFVCCMLSNAGWLFVTPHVACCMVHDAAACYPLHAVCFSCCNPITCPGTHFDSRGYSAVLTRVLSAVPTLGFAVHDRLPFRMLPGCLLRAAVCTMHVAMLQAVRWCAFLLHVARRGLLSLGGCCNATVALLRVALLRVSRCCCVLSVACSLLSTLHVVCSSTFMLSNMQVPCGPSHV